MNSTRDRIQWPGLEDFAAYLSQAGIQPGTVVENDWKILGQALRILMEEEDWQGILRLRRLFDPLYARDAVTALPILQELDAQAIAAARRLEDSRELAHLLGAKGHNLHRQGYHLEAIQAFDQSANHYRTLGEDPAALENYYMTSLCYRAVGQRDKAKHILDDVLNKTASDDPWRGNPLQVMAWIAQDEGKLVAAEKLLRQALELHRQAQDSDILLAGALADAGEVVGILGRAQEARQYFEESLSTLARHHGQYDRQEARTLLKYAELLMHHKDYSSALRSLNMADDKIRSYGHYYDLLWQIELARGYIFLRRGDISNCISKLRSTFRIRKHLGLSNALLVQQVMQRYAQRLWR